MAGRLRCAAPGSDKTVRDRQAGFVGGDDAHGVKDAFRRYGLEEEPARSGAQGGVDVDVEVEGGQDEDAGSLVGQSGEVSFQRAPAASGRAP
jgi:hypothetical protein